MLPVIALVGRPNVGKSTLFNRLTKTRAALVANHPGLTRDRQYGQATLNGTRCLLIDTGGIRSTATDLDQAVAAQAQTAIQESTAIVFLVDARSGPTPEDEHLATQLRKQKTPVLLAANKIDGTDPTTATAEFYRLGLGQVHPISAAHGRGITSLAAQLAALFPQKTNLQTEPPPDGIRIALVGRPNVGKSTLANRLLGQDRALVSDQPGTTRDSLYLPYQRNKKPYTLIDTAGIRRRKNVRETIEKFSIVKTLQAIADSHLALLLIDSQEGLVDQDLHLCGQIIHAGRALVIALNKWDSTPDLARRQIKASLDRRLQFADFAECHPISARTGSGLAALHKAIDRAYESATRPLPTAHLTRILEQATARHPPPLVRGRRIKLRYAHAGGQNPPVLVLHGTQTDALPDHYQRYLEKHFRGALGLAGTPIRLELRTAPNPYAGRKNQLTPRQAKKKRRLLQHVKKRK
ncbi:MAG: ribosome biogenesis GTPase Der [Cellvibrionales bacterium]|nr:ribosome biogenesis GTPase Der [Cellvibrionales bacterium]